MVKYGYGEGSRFDYCRDARIRQEHDSGHFSDERRWLSTGPSSYYSTSKEQMTLAICTNMSRLTVLLHYRNLESLSSRVRTLAICMGITRRAMDLARSGDLMPVLVITPESCRRVSARRRRGVLESHLLGRGGQHLDERLRRSGRPVKDVDITHDQLTVRVTNGKFLVVYNNDSVEACVREVLSAVSLS